MATRRVRVGLAAGVAAVCATGGILALGTTASAAPSTRSATVVFDCVWQPSGGGTYGAAFGTSPNLTLAVTTVAKIGEKADLSAKVKDGKFLAIPAGSKPHDLAYTGAAMTATVSDGDAGTSPNATLATSGDATSVGADGVVTVGEFTQQYPLAQTGSLIYVVKSVTLKFTDKADGSKAHDLVCTAKSTAGSWPIVVVNSATTSPPVTGPQTLQQSVIASGPAPTGTTTGPTATATRTTTAPTTSAPAGTTSSGASGGLAPTGSGGAKVLAFALLAASLLLGSLAVILALPNRRRSRPLT